MITARLKSKKSKGSFNIGVYHMPCAFRTPQVMSLHSALAIRRSQEVRGCEERKKRVCAGIAKRR